MATLDELKFTALHDAGYTSGSLNEREHAWLVAESGSSTTDLNQLWIDLLVAKGYTSGSVNERQIQMWASQGFTGSWNEMAIGFWAAGGTLPA